MSFLTSKQFWSETAERAVKTGAQAVLLALGADVGFNLFQVDVYTAGGAFLGGVFLSVLTSLISGTATKEDTPSLVG